ncbi:MAG: low temperature requirement protein A [Caldilineaceae bacterium]
MNNFQQNVRLWWQPPRRTSDREAERRVTFLELFYDLVYVVVIAEVSHALAGHVDRQGILEFGLLFVLVWVAWINGTFYHELHGNNDIRTRVFTFLQMFTVAMMAVFAHNAFGEGGAGFALSFAAYQLVLTYLWWRTGVYDPLHRPLAQPYVLNYLISTVLFVTSAFVPEAWRTYFWLTSLILSVSGPLITVLFAPSDPEVQAEQERSRAATDSLVERFGLFIIIVLGEVIVAVVRGVAAHHGLDLTIFLTAGLGMLLAVGLWWLYFDFVSQRLPVASNWGVPFWIYLHLFVAMGIVATGAATLNVVEHASEPLGAVVTWLLTGALALAMGTIALLLLLLRLPEAFQPLYRRGALITLLAAAGCAALGFTTLPAIPLLTALVVLLLLPVIYGIHVWITVLGGREFTVD